MEKAPSSVLNLKVLVGVKTSQMVRLQVWFQDISGVLKWTSDQWAASSSRQLVQHSVLKNGDNFAFFCWQGHRTLYSCYSDICLYLESRYIYNAQPQTAYYWQHVKFLCSTVDQAAEVSRWLLGHWLVWLRCLLYCYLLHCILPVQVSSPLVL